jgi:hypothetical protein
VEKGGVPGVVALVYRQGREHVETIGRMDVEGRDPMRRNALFRLASTTKAAKARPLPLRRGDENSAPAEAGADD